MLRLFRKKNNYADKVIKEISGDYSSLMVDMHSHVLPGIDDGAQTPEESLVLIRKKRFLFSFLIVPARNTRKYCS